jgi:hypothetical protein
MIIKEPLLKNEFPSKKVMIRCDSPSDVIFIDEEDQEMLKETKWLKSSNSTFDHLKANGNHCFL